MCTAIHMLVLTYWQSVMYEIDPKVNYNGYQNDLETMIMLVKAAIDQIDMFQR